MIYKVVWDNGADACGAFDCIFQTFDEALAYGEAWLDEFNRDNAIGSREHNRAYIKIIEVEAMERAPDHLNKDEW